MIGTALDYIRVWLVGIDSVKDYAVKYSVKDSVKELDKFGCMRHLVWAVECSVPFDIQQVWASWGSETLVCSNLFFFL